MENDHLFRCQARVWGITLMGEMDLKNMLSKIKILQYKCCPQNLSRDYQQLAFTFYIIVCHYLLCFIVSVFKTTSWVCENVVGGLFSYLNNSSFATEKLHNWSDYDHCLVPWILPLRLPLWLTSGTFKKGSKEPSFANVQWAQEPIFAISWFLYKDFSVTACGYRLNL